MLNDYQNQVDRLVRDDSGRILPDDLDAAIEQAVRQFSKDSPRKVVEDIDGDGSYWLDLPEGWQADFSELLGIEYPIGETPRSYIESPEIYNGPESDLIHLGEETVADGEPARVSYTQMHEVSDEADTVPLVHRTAVSLLAASILCEQLASAYTGDTNSMIGADSVDHQSKSRDFAARARDLRKRYQDLLGVEDRTASPAGSFVDLDHSLSTGGYPVFHRRRAY